MRCASKAATEAVARMRAAGEQASQDPTTGAPSPAASDRQPATPNAAGAHGHPRAASSSTASAAGGSHMDDDLEIVALYSGESDSPSDSKLPAKSIRKAAGAETTAAPPCGSPDPDLRHELFGSSDESEGLSRGSSQSHLHSVSANDKHDDAGHRDDVVDSSRSHRSRSNLSVCGDRSVHRDTTQEEQDRDALQSAPENKPSMPSLSNLRE